MYIVSSNTQFRTIFVPRLDKFEMLVKLKITNNLLKSLSTFICEVWQGYPESNREALRHWFLSYLMTLMYNQHSQVILGIPPIIDQLLFCIVNTVKPVQLIYVLFVVPFILQIWRIMMKNLITPEQLPKLASGSVHIVLRPNLRISNKNEKHLLQ